MIKHKILYTFIFVACAFLVFANTYQGHIKQIEKENLSNIELITYYQELTKSNPDKSALIIEYLLLNSLLEGNRLDHKKVKNFVLQDNGHLWQAITNEEMIFLFNNENYRLISFVLSILNKDIEDEEQKKIILNACVNKFDMLYEIENKARSKHITPSESLLAKNIILEPYHSLFQNSLYDSFLKQNLNVKL
jgi:predicted small secreted protein